MLEQNVELRLTSPEVWESSGRSRETDTAGPPESYLPIGQERTNDCPNGRSYKLLDEETVNILKTFYSGHCN
jgi:hypothetical protein